MSYTLGIMPQTQPPQANLQQVNLQHAHHCVYDLHYHFVFVVKYRRALLRPEVEEQLVRISHEVAERYEFEIETLGADLNHVHLLCSAPPKVAPSEIVRIYKSITTVQEHHHGADVSCPAATQERVMGGQTLDGRLLCFERRTAWRLCRPKTLH